MYNRNVNFEWDPGKNKINIKKHKVSFEEAQTVFFDPLTKVADDPVHSAGEDRFIAIGNSSLQRTLLVVHCYHESDAVIRIISARKLTKTELRQYEEIL